MILKNQDGREIELETDINSDGSRFFSYGVYVDTEAVLTGKELDKLSDDYSDVLDELSFETALAAAADFYEGDR